METQQLGFRRKLVGAVIIAVIFNAAIFGLAWIYMYLSGLSVPCLNFLYLHPILFGAFFVSSLLILISAKSIFHTGRFLALGAFIFLYGVVFVINEWSAVYLKAFLHGYGTRMAGVIQEVDFGQWMSDYGRSIPVKNSDVAMAVSPDRLPKELRNAPSFQKDQPRGRFIRLSKGDGFYLDVAWGSGLVPDYGVIVIHDSSMTASDFNVPFIIQKVTDGVWVFARG